MLVCIIIGLILVILEMLMALFLFFSAHFYEYIWTNTNPTFWRVLYVQKTFSENKRYVQIKGFGLLSCMFLWFQIFFNLLYFIFDTYLFRTRGNGGIMTRVFENKTKNLSVSKAVQFLLLPVFGMRPAHDYFTDCLMSFVTLLATVDTLS